MTNGVTHFKFDSRGKRRLHKSPAQQEIEACNLWPQHSLAGLMDEPSTRGDS